MKFLEPEREATMRSFYKFVVLLMLTVIATSAWGWSDKADASTAAAAPPARIGEVTERIFTQEAKLVENMHGYSPLVETYIQRLKPDVYLWTVDALHPSRNSTVPFPQRK